MAGGRSIRRVSTGPDVRYARSGEVSIAYTRWGEGDDVIVFTPPLMTNAELCWELPEWARALRRGGRYAQHVLIDKRGIGLSDRVAVAPSIADHVADVIAVMDAEGLASAHIAGFSEGGIHGVALAALHPERVRRLLMVGAPAAGVPIVELEALTRPTDRALPAADELGAMGRQIIKTWGTEDSEVLRRYAPSVAGSPHIRQWHQRFERQSASPGTVRDFFRAQANYDVRPHVAGVGCQVMVAHMLGDKMVHPAHARWYARHLAHTTHVEFDCSDHVWWFAPDWELMQTRLLEFVLDRSIHDDTTRIVNSVLFTDIVDSTAQASTVGNARWNALLDTHEHVSAGVTERHRGRVVKAPVMDCWPSSRNQATGCGPRWRWSRR